MTKAEFLELRAGEQRWILLRCLLMMFVRIMATLLPDEIYSDPPAMVKRLGDDFDEVVDRAAEEDPC